MIYNKEQYFKLNPRNKYVVQRIKLHTLFILIFLALPLTAQSPDTLWSRTLGGTIIDVGHSIQQTQDGGYIVAGYTRSYGTMSGRNALLIKTDSLGNEEWHSALGGNADEEAYGVMQMADGGYVFSGYTKSFGLGLNDVLLIKTDSIGNSQWIRTFGGAQDDEGYSLQQTIDGGFIIAGVTSSFGTGSRDMWLIKTDSTGNEEWNRTFGGFSSDGAWSVQQTLDGGYILTGWTFSNGPGYLGNAWLVKTDTAGIMEWNRYFGGSDADRGCSVQQTTDGGYILTGYTGSSGAGLYDMLLIKTDSSGHEQWNRTFGGSGRDYGNSVRQTEDGGFIVTGYTLSFGAGGDDLWLVKTNANGVEEWSNTYGGSASDVGYDVQLTTDDGTIAVGHTLSFGAGLHDVFLVKLAPETKPLITLTPDSLWFGSIMQGDTLIDSVLVHNAGTADLNITSVISTNPDFSIFPLTATILADSTEWFYIQLNAITSGNQRGDVVFYHNAPGAKDTVIVQADVISMVSGNEEKKLQEFLVEPNFPNPFNPATRIRYQMTTSAEVRLVIYNLTGQIVRTLLNKEQAAGNYEQVWNGKDDLGREAASGVYIVRLSAENFSKSYRMILMR